jgi:ABC-type antimicrobial peptide transport system permease subunit
MRMIIRQGLVSVVIGLVVGGVASYFVVPILDENLTGLSVTDPVTATVIVLLLLAVTLLAGWVPARRATRVAPQEALRVD